MIPSLTGSTLVVACVSVGNVGQLATDVILATLHKYEVNIVMSEDNLLSLGRASFSLSHKSIILQLFLSVEQIL